MLTGIQGYFLRMDRHDQALLASESLAGSLVGPFGCQLMQVNMVWEKMHYDLDWETSSIKEWNLTNSLKYQNEMELY